MKQNEQFILRIKESYNEDIDDDDVDGAKVYSKQSSAQDVDIFV